MSTFATATGSAAGAAAAKFKSSPTRGIKGGGGRTGMALWLASVVVFIIGAFLGPLVYLGLVVFIIASIIVPIIAITGVKDFYRKGDCPHCATEVRVLSSSTSGVSCPGCKHRLILRNERLVDITG